MRSESELRALEVDLASNTLRLVLLDNGEADVERQPDTATIDIGAGGRLIGVELAGGYIDVVPPEPGTEHLIRSADAQVEIERGQGSGAISALILPRIGAGYEITYPSGNQ